MARLVGYLLMLAIFSGLMSIGVKGFSAQGLPWSRTRKLTGVTAWVIGSICILFGIAGISLGIYDAIITYGPKQEVPVAVPTDLPPPIPPEPRKKPKKSDKPIDGLIAYWNFDEKEGTKILDLSKRGHHATLHGGKRVEGVKGNAIRLSGKGDFIDYGTSADFNFPANAPFTVSGWVKTDSSGGTVLSQVDSETGKSRLHVGLSTGFLEVYLRGRNEDGPGMSIHNRIMKEKWSHFAFIRGADNEKVIYVDGDSRGTFFGIERAPAEISTNKRHLGFDYYEAQQTDKILDPYFNGSVDEFCFFNRALTAEEVERLSTMDSSALPQPLPPP